MSTIVTIQSSDLITNSRADINTNFANLNSDKIETSTLDTDTTLAANSDSKIPTQKAVKAYVDTGGNVNASETTKGIVEEATDAEVTAGTATGATGAKLFVTPAKLATRLTTGTNFSSGVSAKDMTDANGATTVIAHGLGTTPKKVKFSSVFGTSSVTNVGRHSFSFGVCDGTNSYSIENHFESGNSYVSSSSNSIVVSMYESNSAYQTATCTLDATNITLTWAKYNAPSNTGHILWEAFKY